MNPIQFEGSKEVGKPKDMTDEECFSVWAKKSTDAAGRTIWQTMWQPSYEDRIAIAAGRPIVIQSTSDGLVPMLPYTYDEDGNPNDE
jgi:hypothetical protein